MSNDRSARQRPTREQTRTRVVAAAALAFSSRGYLGVSLDDIAAEAGLTKGAVYSSFGSKAALFLAVLQVRTDERLFTATDLSSPADVGRLLERFTVDDPTWHRAFLEFWASVVAGGAGDDLADLRTSRRVLRSLIAEAIAARGVSEGRAMRLAVLVLALSNGLAIERSLDEDGAADGVFVEALGNLLTGIGQDAAE